MARLFGDVEYYDDIYQDAELIDGSWFFYDAQASFGPFIVQWRVHPLNKPEAERRHHANTGITTAPAAGASQVPAV